MMTLLDYFRLFYPLPDTDFDAFQRLLKPKSFKKGSMITIPGQVQTELYIVQRGVQMSFFDAEQKTHVIAFTYPPNLCAIPESFSFQAPSRYFLTCLTDSEMLYLTFNELEQLMQEQREIERLFRKMTEAILSAFIARHIELHSLTMAERFKTFCERSPHLLQMVPHKYIASYLGIDPTNFSKLYNSIKL